MGVLIRCNRPGMMSRYGIRIDATGGDATLQQLAVVLALTAGR